MEVTAEHWAALMDQIADLSARLGEVRAAVVDKPAPKDWYTTEEAAHLLGKTPYTVREYCRDGRIHAKKRRTGRGTTTEWVVGRAEIERIRNEGLLPRRKHEPDRL